MNILENKIIPAYYDNKEQWALLSRQAVRTSEGYFNSDRMVIEYFNTIYKPTIHGSKCECDETNDVQIAENPNLDAWSFSKSK
jgi:starch phosphorylase